MLEHPIITAVNQTGYPDLREQQEHAGMDYFGNEILVGDDIFEDPNNGEVVLKENLEEYLAEVYGFEFKEAM